MDKNILWTSLILGIFVSFAWRFAGVAFSARLNPKDPLFLWVQSIAYAMLAALVMRMIVFPAGPLEETQLWHRIAASTLAIAIFYSFRRKLLLAVISGTGIFILLQIINM
tara:strand:- start:7394 stop:7723 length:330 start_codon:yes stop_codon:yes gene_type:complete